jgi:hypothetical protein
VFSETHGRAVFPLKGLYEAFRKQSAWLQLAVAGALAAIVFHPRSRAKILGLWKGVSKSAVNVKGPLLEVLLAVMKEIATAQSGAHRKKREIESVLPPTKMYEAFREVLTQADMTDGAERVWNAGIPFRTGPAAHIAG